jgi:hypothetical protein
MRLEDYRHPKAEAGRVLQANGHPLYCTIVKAKGLALTVHCSWDAPDELWVSSGNAANDYRPIRLTVAEATALRDGLSLFIAEHSTPPSEKERS